MEQIENGCKYHDNCFECPYNDCIAEELAKHITKKVFASVLKNYRFEEQK